jgi:hypothetical protein
MDYIQWVNLFGKSADDAQVRNAVSKAGITKPLKIGGDELSVRADIKGQGTTIIFTDETILHPDAAGVVGRPILSSVLMILQGPNKANLYKGLLPFELKKDDSRESVRARLGPPVQSNDEYRTDMWLVDGSKLAATYAQDLQSLTRISVSLPEHK